MAPRRSPNVRAAAARVHDARLALAAARQELAARTPPGAAPVLHARAVGASKAALARHRDRLLGFPGVVGVGLGYRVRDGEPDLDERCVTVYVRRKHTRAHLDRNRRQPLPRRLSDARGRRVGVDVVEFGRLVRQVQGGEDLGPGTIAERGTVGVIGVDLSGGRPVVLTAMHVVGGPDVAAPDAELVAESPSMQFPAHRRLGMVLRGTMSGTDAALIEVDRPDAAVRAIAGIGPVAGWRPLLNPADVGTAVCMAGAATGRPVYGRIVQPHASLPAYGLRDVILADIPSANGDSGAALVDHDHLVLGLLVGVSSASGHRIFAAIGGVIAALRCDIPPT
ncbi:MAG: trypsin-like peptidase domain-containing protein [Gemmatimonadota bacterium]|nr:trypsin-like peptidase domain-containing protein [Gemmatimonadota bacterium]